MSGFNLPTSPGNEFLGAMLQNENFLRLLQKKLGPLAKADTIDLATNLTWYDLSRTIQNLYPYRELIPCISKLPRVPADGGNAHHWKRITAINTGNVSSGVSVGNRGARIQITEQDMVAVYRTMGLESSVPFEARLAAKNLNPEILGTAVNATLRSVMIQEEQILINSNASLPLGTATISSLTAGGSGGSFASATVYVSVVALTGMGLLAYTPYASGVGGVLGQVTKVNADGSSDTYGGGSSQPSAVSNTSTTSGQIVTGTATIIPGAAAYAWFVGTSATTSNLYLAGVTQSNQAIFTAFPANTNQPLSSLLVGSSFQDNSTNLLLPDGILTQIFGAINGPDPGRAMATNRLLPTGVSLSAGGSLIYDMAAGNTGLTVSGSDIYEIDQLLQGAYEQYKLGFSRILMSAADMRGSFGKMLGQVGSNQNYRLLFDADEETGRIIAGRRVTSYFNKWMNNSLDAEVHPWVPAGTMILWSDRIPYELAGVPNILEAKVRQDYYQIQWPWKSRRYEYGVYVDEVFPCYYTPAFAVITNINQTAGSSTF